MKGSLPLTKSIFLSTSAWPSSHWCEANFYFEKTFSQLESRHFKLVFLSSFFFEGGGLLVFLLCLTHTLSFQLRFLLSLSFSFLSILHWQNWYKASCSIPWYIPERSLGYYNPRLRRRLAASFSRPQLSASLTFHIWTHRRFESFSFVSVSYRTSSLRLTKWFCVSHMVGRWPELLGNSARCPGPKRPLHRYQLLLCRPAKKN